MRSPFRSAAMALPAIAVFTACRVPPHPPAPQPAAHSSPGSTSTPGDTARRVANEADVRFMQDMISHHAQALRMAALVGTRTTRPEMHLLAQRIDISQKDEIAMMQRWLREHDQEAPDVDPPAGTGPHSTPGSAMPGMLTHEQMERIGAARGAAFDRLFLEGMIRHHEGALTMVTELFAAPGAAQESEVFRFASDVDADQRAEIKRMRLLLAGLPADTLSR